jgi:hypothetical protein
MKRSVIPLKADAASTCYVGTHLLRSWLSLLIRRDEARDDLDGRHEQSRSNSWVSP